MEKPKQDHVAPFYCPVKRCRKSAWETPEHLLPSDLKLLAELSLVETVDQFTAVVYETEVPQAKRKGHREAYFWRICGWPEGLHYMQDSEFAASAWGYVKRDLDRAVTAAGARIRAAIPGWDMASASAPS